MAATHEIRAEYDRASIVVYQAYGEAIAKPAVQAQKLVPPFSLHRMTWIKPSFLWMMHRSNWGKKSGQERTLAVRISLAGWDEALSLAVLTSPEPKVHGSAVTWDKEFKKAVVHVQWDTERSLRGAAFDHYSIQVGLSRHIIEKFVEEWILSIEDISHRGRFGFEVMVSGVRLPGTSRQISRPIPRTAAKRSLRWNGFWFVDTFASTTSSCSPMADQANGLPCDAAHWRTPATKGFRSVLFWVPYGHSCTQPQHPFYKKARGAFSPTCLVLVSCRAWRRPCWHNPRPMRKI